MICVITPLEDGILSEAETWILLGDTSRTAVPIRAVKFDWIAMDILCKSPYHINM
jgi:hypothetical protein